VGDSKTKVAALLAGIAIGSTGVALGASNIAPWHHNAPTYFCHGFQGAAWCRARGTPYEAFVSKIGIAIFDVSGGGTIFGCSRPTTGDPNSDCTDFR
jgi:hypothetical protein